MKPVTALSAIYVVGVLVGLITVDGSVATKLAVALTWPLGLVAFVLTIVLLVVVAALAFPVFGATLVAVGLAVWLVVA